uniref:Uncharacterized protein n=1 Tax=Rhizophora mucronata TaxID=61149 RepID=A0A2P2IRB6_RHIMU
MPVDGNVLLNMVCDPHDDIIALPCIKSRPRKLPVDRGNGLV